MTTVANTLQDMKEKFNPDAAAGLDVIFQLDIEDGDTYHIIVKNGTCEINEGASDDPSVTLIMNAETLDGIMTGEVDGMQAFMAGNLRAEGDVMLATKLSELFPID
ncbi:SCP2 sterol-binding domain-containing protein [Zooshikella marina]|uniref:SCP2 sterol-binding domain-containing protein n=1 Tax=Zooshikella ganghwensis TaxID=202772 RepID=UPI0003F71546|nr:SCP2 sterol-binding domain-containing protein [Zooshikella ganghwensis]MBU2705335.1 SCP2 sterol-binding domain-containing protein [Zooshikella ganghwensis]